MDQRSDRKQPTTRPERAKARRRAQGRRNTAAWRRRKRAEREAQQQAPEARREPTVDPIWRDDPQHPMSEPIPPGGPFFQPTPEPDPPQEPEEPEASEAPAPKSRYIRRAAKGPKPPKPVPLARAFDPSTGRRRVRIVQSDGKVIEGEVDGSGSGGIADLDWGNF